MTAAEAERVVQVIKADRRFATRYGEQSWGVEHIGDGEFRQWSHDYAEDRYDEALLDEAGVINLFKGYSLANIWPVLERSA